MQGTILSFLRNNQETLLPYHESSRRDDYTNLVPVTLEAGHYFQALRHNITPAALMVRQ